MSAFAWQIAISPRYELFLALWSALSDKARRHPEWRQRVRGRLPAAFHAAHAAMGDCPEIWILFFDGPGPGAPEAELGDVLAALRRRPAEELVHGLMASLLHNSSAAKRVLARRAALGEILVRLPRRKREWLGFMGLYPHERGRPMVRAVERMIADPAAFKANALCALDLFVREVFAAEWRRLRPQLAKAGASAEAVLESGDWPAIGRALGLNVEFDLARRQLRALRGGFALPFAELGEACFLPSAFNELQFWTVASRPDGRMNALLPFLDPAARLAIDAPKRNATPAAPGDVALVFRALGDATRFAMAGLLARRPMSSAELGRQLGLSKPTVAHHVHELRQAGLLSEQSDGKAVILALDRAALEALSGQAIERLFEAAEVPGLARSRRRL
jgi:DNA-binding transcriptional ArsR family regulator